MEYAPTTILEKIKRVLDSNNINYRHKLEKIRDHCEDGLKQLAACDEMTNKTKSDCDDLHQQAQSGYTNNLNLGPFNKKDM